MGRSGHLDCAPPSEVDSKLETPGAATTSVYAEENVAFCAYMNAKFMINTENHHIIRK